MPGIEAWARRLGRLAMGLILVPAWCLEAQLKISDTGWLRYRVVTLSESKEPDIKLSPETQALSSSATRIYLSSYHNQPAYLMEREDRTLKGDLVLWKCFMEKDTMSLFRTEKKMISRSGKTVKESFTDYQDPMYNYPKNTCHIYTIAAMIMARAPKPGSRFDLALLLNEDAYPIHMWVVTDGIERITVPAGTFDCIRIKLEPDYDNILGRWSWTAPIIRRFVPDYTFWMDQNYTHGLILFSGAFGPIGGASSQRHELTKIEEPEKK